MSHGVELVHVTRGKSTESIHMGHVAIVSADGRLLCGWGDPHVNVFARSSMKPFQALGLVMSGALEKYGFTEQELALACASHSGEERHVALAWSMLQKSGTSEEELQCGAHLPYDEHASRELLRLGIATRQLHNNCSGKHAGMIAAAKARAESTDDYLDKNHPLQRFILNAIAEIGEVDIQRIEVETDGCGAPVFGVPLKTLALLFARLANPEFAPQIYRDPLAKIAQAMNHYPEMVGGTARFDTALMNAFKERIVGKEGAEGVHGLGVMKEGLGIAVKIADGSKRAIYPTVLRALELQGIQATDRDALASFAKGTVKNVAQRTVGEIYAVYGEDSN
ncbi:asparaginase [Ferroacidibacillus organovorans]|uniref:Asparaginase n=1 Tax=Ferroacidibacillus organovorans TaxID=1765683 RepID=A0A853KGA1_9BACL|nr:asparaginase [Ferroacidibacillus organovorans]KYP82127.1 hypothetical protein AYJ22_00285 [Ferroacidibacillus organovorans]OAG94410.1 hypothetical protein AYW79_05175 [Ferroacidibacillus organovorans]